MLQSTICPNNTSNYKNVNIINPQNGEIWYANLGSPDGHIQGGIRPVLIRSNNTFNLFSPIVWIIPISSQINKYSPVHVFIERNYENGLKKDSIALIEQMKPIGKYQLISRIGKINSSKDAEVKDKINFQIQ